LNPVPQALTAFYSLRVLAIQFDTPNASLL
jgi:hypothetical protein